MGRLRPLVRRHGLDLLIAFAAVAGALEVALRHEPGLTPTLTRWLAVPAIVLLVLPLLVRRLVPFAAPAALWLAAAGLSFADGRLVVFPNSVFIAGMAAAFLLGNLRDAFRARVGLAVVLASAATIAANDPGHSAGEIVFTPTLFAIGWLAGFAVRERSEQAEAAEARALQAEREREGAARLAVAEERARIARELHDVVAHAVSVMVLQVGAVRHRLPATLTEDAAALQDVEGVGRTALTEMRRLLGALRDEDDALELAPQPGLGGLDALVDKVGRTGLDVRLHVEGEPVALPRALELSAYRIVQEGLTNVLKHAGAAHADVAVRYRPDELQIEVRDDGRGAAPADGLGHGLIGIRERVKIYGGELTAAAGERGFVLTTRLPLDGRRS